MRYATYLEILDRITDAGLIPVRIRKSEIVFSNKEGKTARVIPGEGCFIYRTRSAAVFRGCPESAIETKILRYAWIHAIAYLGGDE